MPFHDCQSTIDDCFGWRDSGGREDSQVLKGMMSVGIALLRARLTVDGQLQLGRSLSLRGKNQVFPLPVVPPVASHFLPLYFEGL